VGLFFYWKNFYFGAMPLPLLENTILQFPSIQHLWAFQQQVRLRAYQFETCDCTLRAALTEQQVLIALRSFGGKVKTQNEREQKST
jgi:hypothetical protein